MTTPQHAARPEAEAPVEEPSLGTLVADTTRHLSTLIRGEIELAKSELRVSVKAGGMSIAFFALAGFLLLLGIIMLSIAFALFLHWLFFGIATSFLIVFGVYLVLAGLLGYLGVRSIKRVKAPEKTIETVKQAPQAFKRG